MNNPIFKALAEAARRNEPVALGLISGVKGSSPQKMGAKALFYADGRITGTMGGGCLEAEIQRRAVQALRQGTMARFELILDHDFGWDDGLICGGKVEGVILPHAQQVGEKFWAELAERKSHMSWGVQPSGALARVPAASATQDWLYCETVTPPCVLWIAGAGHIAQAVAPLAAQLDFDVTVFDDRPALANHRLFPDGVSLQSDSWDHLLRLPLAAGLSFGLIVTRGHRHDALVLQDWIHKPFQFLGMIGSARKARTIFAHFVEEKIASAEELQRVVCPVGLKIQAQSPIEIAVSILAQLIQKRAELGREKGTSEPA